MRPVVTLGLVGLLAGCSEYTYKSVAPEAFAPFGPDDDPRAGLVGNEASSRPVASWTAPDDETLEAPPPPAEEEELAPEWTTSTPEGAPDTVGFPTGEDPADPPRDDEDPEDPVDIEDPVDPGGDDPEDEDPEDPGDDDPEDGWVPGRIQGHIDIGDDVGVRAKVYCDANWAETSLRIEVGDEEFVLDALEWVLCSDEPDRDPEPMVAGFDTITGEGTGSVGDLTAEIWFLVADGGEPSERDVLEFQITVDGQVWARSGTGERGNLQALPGGS